MLTMRKRLYADKFVDSVSVRKDPAQILIGYGTKSSNEQPTVVLLNVLADHYVKEVARTESPFGIGSLSWIERSEQAVFLGVLQQALWKPGHKPRIVDLLPAPFPLSKQGLLPLLTDAEGRYLWDVELEPSPNPTTVPAKQSGSNLTAAIQVLRGVPPLQRLSVFRGQKNFPVEEQLAQIDDSGERLLAVNSDRVLRIFHVMGQSKTVLLPFPLDLRKHYSKNDPYLTDMLSKNLPSTPRFIGFAPDRTAKQLTALSQNGTVCSYDLATGKLLRSTMLPYLWGNAHIRYSRSGQKLIIGGATNRGVSLYLLDGISLKVKAAVFPKLDTLRGVDFLETGSSHSVLCWGNGGCFIYSY